jgi:antitoxin VapB
MGLFIRDDSVRDMARRLAEARGTTVTEAVRQAIEHELAALQRDRAERERVIRESLARVDAMPRYDFDENEMYDEFGVPR